MLSMWNFIIFLCVFGDGEYFIISTFWLELQTQMHSSKIKWNLKNKCHYFISNDGIEEIFVDVIRCDCLIFVAWFNISTNGRNLKYFRRWDFLNLTVVIEWLYSMLHRSSSFVGNYELCSFKLPQKHFCYRESTDGTSITLCLICNK